MECRVCAPVLGDAGAATPYRAIWLAPSNTPTSSTEGPESGGQTGARTETSIGAGIQSQQGQRGPEPTLLDILPLLSDLSVSSLNELDLILRSANPSGPVLGLPVSMIAEDEIEPFSLAAATFAWEERGSQWERERVGCTTLAGLTPTISRLADRRIDAAEVSTRLYNLMSRHEALTWSALAALSMREVVEWRNAGRLTIIELVKLCVSHALFLAKGSDPGSPSGAKIAGYLEAQWANADLLDAISEIMAWAAIEHDARSVPDAFEIVRRADDLPEAVRAKWSVLSALDTESFIEAHRSKYDPTITARSVIEEISPRSLQILARRAFALRDRATLDVLGKELGVRRERIRQLEVKTVEALRQDLNAPSLESLHRAARRLRASVGAAAPLEALPTVLPDDLPIESFERFYWGLLFWLAGPYEEDEGWVVRVPEVEVVEGTLHLVNAHMDAGFVEVEIAADLLSEIEIAEPFRLAW